MYTNNPVIVPHPFFAGWNDTKTFPGTLPKFGICATAQRFRNLLFAAGKMRGQNIIWQVILSNLDFH